MNDDGALVGRVALVTGGDRGIGAAIALALARAGADVAIRFRTRVDEARAVADRIVALGRRAACVQGDLSLVDQAVAMASDTVRALGDIDVLVCNAGIGRPVELGELDLATFEETLAVNLRAPFVLTHAVMPAMRRRRWGRLICLSSTRS